MTREQARTKLKIHEMKSAFSNYNMVRMREALRYLSGPKLTLFVKIPFLIHTNLPQLPGYVQDLPTAHGIYNFQATGFFKEALSQGKLEEALVKAGPVEAPCVLGLYHIGSLGTFTQSPQSDFDYWVIIDKHSFTEKRYYNFEKKLAHIVKYSREEFSQKVSFFIMDQADIRKDCYAGFNTRETMIAPKLFLKEEFYRTFLMIAGKIPIWTLLPPNIPKGIYKEKVNGLLQKKEMNINREYIDLGKIEIPENQDILKGILWHICKSRQDPVKAMIKASMIMSHRFGSKEQSILLCDEIKKGFALANIDDYGADPYKILFDRVIAFHKENQPGSLNLIKNAIFFRLCEYPMVQSPAPGSPKKQLLDRYIRTWNLNPTQVKKLITYPKWPEQEKRLLEKTFVKQLSRMYKQISQGDELNFSGLGQTDQRNLKILINKTRERLNLSKDKIQESSTYLARQSYTFFLFRKKRFAGWELSTLEPKGSKEITLQTSPSFLGLLGWIIENRLYHRAEASMRIDVKSNLFGSQDQPISADALYLEFQPAKPLSDDVFEHGALWRKLMVLLVESTSSKGFSRVEILALNTWGELFESQLELDTQTRMDDRYKKIASQINLYKGKNLKLLFYQMSDRRDPDAVFRISQYLEPRFFTPQEKDPLRKRPLLDKL
ncbi:MAG: class I adenylate cyclase [Desulfobacter sp.]|nr:MAG: class I adenylate cyclase [Desulfobacter sp.]